MFGKCFSKMYRGSMRGKGPEVFALWPYIISNCDRYGFLELNPEIVAFEIGMPEDRVIAVLDGFLKPDPKSRRKELEGRKLERVEEYMYRVVNYEYYRSQKNVEDRRDSNREAAERYREKKKEGKKKGVARDHKAGEIRYLKTLEADGQEAADKQFDEEQRRGMI